MNSTREQIASNPSEIPINQGNIKVEIINLSAVTSPERHGVSVDEPLALCMVIQFRSMFLNDIHTYGVKTSYGGEEFSIDFLPLFFSLCITYYFSFLIILLWNSFLH